MKFDLEDKVQVVDDRHPLDGAVGEICMIIYPGEYWVDVGREDGSVGPFFESQLQLYESNE